MKILAVDLGQARTGLAISDPREMLASPVGTLEEYNPERLVQRVAAIAVEQGAELLVVGHPRNMDGSRGESARRAEAFAQALGEATGLPVEMWDERMTTVSSVQTMMRGCNIVLGYDGKSYLSQPQGAQIGTYLREGDTIIDSFFNTGNLHSQYSDFSTTARAVYVADAYGDTLYNHLQDAGTYVTEDIRMAYSYWTDEQ